MPALAGIDDALATALATSFQLPLGVIGKLEMGNKWKQD